MSEAGDGRMKLDITLDLPEEVGAVIQHKAVMTQREPADILQEIVQQMFNDQGAEIAQLLSD